MPKQTRIHRAKKLQKKINKLQKVSLNIIRAGCLRWSQDRKTTIGKYIIVNVEHSKIISSLQCHPLFALISSTKTPTIIFTANAINKLHVIESIVCTHITNNTSISRRCINHILICVLSMVRLINGTIRMMLLLLLLFLFAPIHVHIR